jgi:hypothetical protein
MGDLLAGVGPHIVVSVAGTTVGSAFVNETAFTSKTFTFDATAGVQQVRVTFDNDDASSTEDRNLLLDWVEVQETPASGGTCSDTSYEGEAMAWSGVDGTDGEIRTDPAPTHRYFWQDSYASQNHAFTAQPMRIRFRAAGDLVDGVGPHVVVSVGGVDIGSAFVNDASYVDKVFEFTPSAGTQQIRVTYDNDLWVSPGGAGNDRGRMDREFLWRASRQHHGARSSPSPSASVRAKADAGAVVLEEERCRTVDVARPNMRTSRGPRGCAPSEALSGASVTRRHDRTVRRPACAARRSARVARRASVPTDVRVVRRASPR